MCAFLDSVSKFNFVWAILILNHNCDGQRRSQAFLGRVFKMLPLLSECARPRAQQLPQFSLTGNHENPFPHRESLWPGTATLRILKTRTSRFLNMRSRLNWLASIWWTSGCSRLRYAGCSPGFAEKGQNETQS